MGVAARGKTHQDRKRRCFGEQASHHLEDLDLRKVVQRWGEEDLSELPSYAQDHRCIRTVKQRIVSEGRPDSSSLIFAVCLGSWKA